MSRCRASASTPSSTTCASQGAEAVALGCTELSVLYEDLGVDDPTVIDSIDALARRVVLRAGAPLRA